MNVSEYVEVRKKELDQFESFWEKRQGAEDWPEQMEDEEWFEQEIAFQSYLGREDT